MSEIERQQQRLSWQCRRGMLELDLMLQGFVDRCYPQLNEHERQGFEQLLQAPDQLLLEYLMGRTVPFDKDVADVARRVRENAAL